MSVKSGIAASPGLVSRLESMRSENSRIRVLKVQVVEETLQETGYLEGAPTKGSIKNDNEVVTEKFGGYFAELTAVSSMVDETAAAYFLLRSSPSKWLLIQWVPVNLAKVKERMVYASTHAILKDTFGQEYIVDVVNVTTKDELKEKSESAQTGGVTATVPASPLSPTLSSSSINSINNKKTPSSLPARLQNDLLLSVGEKSEREAILAEDQARKELAEDGKDKRGGIGGYHAVSATFSKAASDALAKFKSSEVNFIELVVGDDQKTVTSSKAISVSQTDVERNVNANEPRFYLYSYGSTGIKKNVFIYCCPEKSPTKMRMVYSTTKPSIISTIEAQSIELAKKLEISDVADMKHAAIVEAVNDDGRSYAFQQSNIPPSPAISGPASPHPLFGHAPGNDGKASPVLPSAGRTEFEAGAISVGSGRKKIVLPPAVAYQ